MLGYIFSYLAELAEGMVSACKLKVASLKPTKTKKICRNFQNSVELDHEVLVISSNSFRLIREHCFGHFFGLYTYTQWFSVAFSTCT